MLFSQNELLSIFWINSRDVACTLLFFFLKKETTVGSRRANMGEKFFLLCSGVLAFPNLSTFLFKVKDVLLCTQQQKDSQFLFRCTELHYKKKMYLNNRERTFMSFLHLLRATKDLFGILSKTVLL